MQKEQVKEVIACLGDQRRVFRYFRDRYCIDLIEIEMTRRHQTEMKVAELKACGLNRYVQKTIVADMLKRCANGFVSKCDLQAMWQANALPLLVEMAVWGNAERGWDQTSRNQSNLTLRLNFDQQHDAQYQRLIEPRRDSGPFEYWWHPINTHNRRTMSWVRMDIDFDTDEVLIEEIQNDWLRSSSAIWQHIQKARNKYPTVIPQDINPDICGSFENLRYYVEVVLAPYRQIWAEASMLAALRFVHDELGISTVFYHSYETGIKLKRVVGKPPRSIYTQLPKRFGFTETHEPPELLRRHKFAKRCVKAIDSPYWYRLQV